MKHLKLLVLLVGLAYAGIARSDIVMVDALSLCGFRISNVDDYPKIALVAVIHNKGSNDDQNIAFLVKSNQRYRMGESISIHFYIVDKSYIESKELSSIHWEKDSRVKKINYVLKKKDNSNLKGQIFIDNFKLTKSMNKYMLTLTKVEEL
jgi:hypothetical protein